jgi:hypothetical protein
MIEIPLPTSPLEGRLVPARGGIATPPRGFRKPRGRVRGTRMAYSAEIPFGEVESSGGVTKSQRAGLNFEAKVLDGLCSRYPGLLAQPWLRYWDSHGPRLCCPDALLFTKSMVLIVEIKLSHTVSAYWQLKHHYFPVVCSLYPSVTVGILEICRTYDPHIALPEPQLLVTDLDAYIASKANIYGVMRWPS